MEDGPELARTPRWEMARCSRVPGRLAMEDGDRFCVGIPHVCGGCSGSSILDHLGLPWPYPKIGPKISPKIQTHTIQPLVTTPSPRAPRTGKLGISTQISIVSPLARERTILVQYPKGTVCVPPTLRLPPSHQKDQLQLPRYRRRARSEEGLFRSIPIGGSVQPTAHTSVYRQRLAATL